MLQEVAPTPIRYRIRLTVTQNSALEEYLKRTTLFWNLLMFQLRHQFETYMLAPLGSKADEEIHRVAEQFFKEFIDPNGIYAVDISWIRFVNTIKELPADILWSRMDDLLEAYRLAKMAAANGKEATTGIPRHKSKNSSLSVRFNPGMYSLKNDQVIIHTSPRFDFALLLGSLPGDAAVIEKTHSLSITRRRLSNQPDDSFGPKSQEDARYVVTFREYSET